MAHYHFIEDDKGDLVDVLTFCSDGCHQTYCLRYNTDYRGWNGCHELEFSTPCAYCGEIVAGVYEAL